MTSDPSRDELVRLAQDVPGLLASAKQQDPQLFAALTAQNAKSVWLGPLTSVIVLGATKFGFGWDNDTCGIIALVVLAAGTGLAHWVMLRTAVTPTPAPTPTPTNP